jgi:hypothetical protein
MERGLGGEVSRRCVPNSSGHRSNAYAPEAPVESDMGGAAVESPRSIRSRGVVIPEYYVET